VRGGRSTLASAEGRRREAPGSPRERGPGGSWTARTPSRCLSASEAALRIIALARKNSLFFGNDAAGERFAVLHSLIATCQKHDVNPVEYLTDVLIRIHDYPKSNIAELLPHRWKMSFAKSADEIAPDTPTEAI